MSNLTVNGRPYQPLYIPGQEEIFWQGHTEQFTVVPKGRRFGATHGALISCVELLLEGKSILWVDTIQSNLDKYFSKYMLPELNKFKQEFWKWRGVQKDLTLVNTQMDFRSAERPENIEGFAYHVIIINEAGIVLKGLKGRALWFNTIYPMVLDYAAIVYFLGTPKGKKAKKDEKAQGHKTTLYYDLAIKGGLKDKSGDGGYSEDEIEALLKTERDISSDITAEALNLKYKKHPNYRALQYTSYDNPLLTPELIKELEDDVPRVVRKQEIRGEFIDMGDEEIFKAKWFDASRIVDELPADHLLGRRIMSMDTAFKKGAENDDSAIVVFQEAFIEKLQVWFWLYCYCGKLEFPELLEKAKEMYLYWNPDVTLIEDKASGTPLIQTFRTLAGFPVKAITPTTDKVNRAVACTPWFDNEQIYLLFGAWNQLAIDQLCDFNALLDTPDDVVDAVSQLLNWVKNTGRGAPRPISRPRPDVKTKLIEGYVGESRASGRSQTRRRDRMLEGYPSG